METDLAKVQNLTHLIEHGQNWMWEVSSLPDKLPLQCDTKLPKISVITPSFNQGKFIERTIRSVLLQSYQPVEYIVIDGGSTDNTIDILRKYEKHLTYWASEPDRGQSHAINKGFSMATGQILCWLNSDDFYFSDTLKEVAKVLADDKKAFALVGHCLKVYNDDDRPILLEGNFESRRRMLEFWKGYQMHQPAIFWRREVFEQVGWLNEDLNLIMDFDYWARIAEQFNFLAISKVLAGCCYHSDAKTGDNYLAYHQDLKKFSRCYWGRRSSRLFAQLYVSNLRHVALPNLVKYLKHTVHTACLAR